MSSFPQHVKNIKKLESMGFDVSDFLEKDCTVSMESQGYDELTDLLQRVISELESSEFMADVG